MPFYQYYGRDGGGVPVQGKIKGATETDIRAKLERKQIYPKEINLLEGWLYQDIKLFQKARPKDLVLFLRQMATLLQAGISLVESIQLLADQMQNKIWKDTLRTMEEDIRGGTPFSAAAEKHRHMFPALMTNMIKAGEAAGDLDEVMDRLAFYYEKQYRLRQKVISSVSYPIILSVVAFAVVIFLLAVVVPTFVDMFASFGSDLPWITNLVLQTGMIVTELYWLVFPLIILIAAAAGAVKKNPQAKYYLDYALLRLPVLGSVLQKAALARMSRTWSSLFASSVPVLHATSIVERVVGNEVLARVIRDSRQSLERGESLTTPMKSHWIFPPLVTQMVNVGEKTGTLDQMFGKIADFYEQEVDQATDQMKSLLEPALIVLMSVVVGIIVAAIAIPMFEVFEVIQ
ncbi:type II secretion system F family protein [Alkalicoccus daliensis]|uniref:Type IV pilus assembly protein PilC n=1 Tax=Alkalicoccus daliensis TaxID=745820 RepID=A0A1H0CM04_9BACI|nr:type II secretion system F family protein [Alkalicoccus daliensis]SDN58883.1 type IV pilus assembly protein PilC [Alkalicoccus daliensis]